MMRGGEFTLSVDPGIAKDDVDGAELALGSLEQSGEVRVTRPGSD